MTSIRFGLPREEYGFLSPFYPAPFITDNVRWRTIEHYYWAKGTSGDQELVEKIRNTLSPSDILNIPMKTNWNDIATDGDVSEINRILDISITISELAILEAMIAKFRKNPSLANMLRDTTPYTLIYNVPEQKRYERLGSLLMYIRDYIIKLTVLNVKKNDVIFANFYSILEGMGYSYIEKFNDQSVHIPLTEGIKRANKENIRDMWIRTSSEKPASIPEGIVDIYLNEEEPYTEERLREVLDPYKNMENRPSYFIVAANISKSNIKKILKSAVYGYIHLYSPSELSILPSRHMLCPQVEKILPSDAIYSFLKEKGEGISEISATDPLIKEKGYIAGDILSVKDFSPHYRRVIP